jgi:hypothetical protein
LNQIRICSVAAVGHVLFHSQAGGRGVQGNNSKWHTGGVVPSVQCLTDFSANLLSHQHPPIIVSKIVNTKMRAVCDGDFQTLQLACFAPIWKYVFVLQSPLCQTLFYVCMPMKTMFKMHIKTSTQYRVESSTSCTYVYTYVHVWTHIPE